MEKPPIFTEMLYKIIYIGNIRQIAAALAGNADLAARLAHLLQNEDGSAGLGGLTCGHQPCRPATDDK